MTTTNQNREKFQQLLQELFQFDCADLDFGIYRIMNEKREVISKFIEEDLPEAVARDLEQGALATQDHDAEQLAESTEKVREILGPGVLDGDGNLDEKYHDIPIGREYLARREKAAGGRGREALEADLFNHLYAFFSRYYQDGDFISKRRYSRRERYAIPYNGEEVHLHWANNDQYYIKTAEHFHDYAFAASGISVRFQLRAADVEQNNVKGDRRFFLPQIRELAWDEEQSQLVIPFEYRPLMKQEEISYGKSNRQDAIIREALAEIPGRMEREPRVHKVLTSAHHRDGDGNHVMLLEHHLRRYVRRNTSDFFIHKDLKNFLFRELDFYLKNEVLNLDEMQAAGEDRAEGWFQMMRMIKVIGGRIIEFLDQIENFQKMLWEKRKFITEAKYCISVGNISEQFYPAIARCEPQWEEWEGLFCFADVDTDLLSSNGAAEKERIAFLHAHPTLVLDTKHFDVAFVDDLLASFEDMDGITDGLLIHSENWQALGFLQGKYSRQIKCIYIDPPYNTAASEILYKNSYKRSSWLAFMENRITHSLQVMSNESVFILAIDDTEMINLCHLLEKCVPDRERNVVVVNHHPAGAGLEGTNISSTHEYAIFMLPYGSKILRGEKKHDGKVERGFVRTGTAESNLRSGRPNSFYAILVEPETYKVMGAEQPPQNDDYPKENTSEGWIRIYPIGLDGTERVWRRSYESFMNEYPTGNILCRNGKSIYQVIEESDSYRPVFSNWTDKKYNAGAYGSNVLTDIMGRAGSFSYPKSIYTVQDCIKSCAYNIDGDIVLDYFSGSGTTGHAVINLNREDAARRKFILVEMGEYFDTVLLPRIKKVTFAPVWKKGKPVCLATPEEAERGPRIIKYMRLESYEDALNNIAFDGSVGQKVMEFDDYLLQYMLRWETKYSETLLNVEQLARPFDYRLNAHANGVAGGKPADVAETFNYLLGLHVQTRRVYDDDGRRYLVYRGQVDHRKVAVIWRNTEGWQQKDLKRDKKFVLEHHLAEGADEIFVNGDSFIPGAKSLEPVFRARMFGPVEG